jgi:hypothetical protein
MILYPIAKEIKKILWCLAKPVCQKRMRGTVSLLHPVHENVENGYIGFKKVCFVEGERYRMRFDPGKSDTSSLNPYNLCRC